MLDAITNLDDYALRIQAQCLPMSRVLTPAGQKHGIDWQMARLDLLDTELSGNKLFKLLPFLFRARAMGKACVLSFGGMHSNHLHALAAAGRRFGFRVVAIVRGYASQPESPTLNDLRRWDAEIIFADRATYSRRYDPDYLAHLAAAFPDALIIPEGGAGDAGIEGIAVLAAMLARSLGDSPCTIALASGTGTTFLGLLASGAFLPGQVLAAYPALQNATELRQKAMACGGDNHPGWEVTDEYCLGGFARMNRELALFIRVFEDEQQILLDPVYTAKLCYAIEQQIENGHFPCGSRIVTLHTGGLQGRRGMQAMLDKYCHEAWQRTRQQGSYTRYA